MELSWSTFVFEIINFLILVWILKRCLYQPVLGVIARRREGVEKTLADAQALKAEAEALQDQYRRRLADWEQEKAQAWEALQREINAERNRQMEQLQTTLAQERERDRILEVRRLEELARRQEEAAIVLAGRFAQRLLERLAGPELEARLIDATLEDLAQLPAERREALQTAYENDTVPLQISGAYPLDEARKERLQQALHRLLGRTADCRFNQAPELIAGLRITLGSWVVRANLHDELHFFTEIAHARP